nr:DUF6531 domain-containing protein [Pinirhizobacter soli]
MQDGSWQHWSQQQCDPQFTTALTWSSPAAVVAPRGGGSIHAPANTFNTAAADNDKNTCAKVSDPVDVSSGYKTEHFVDFAVPVEMGLRYDRYYVSHFAVGGAGLGAQAGLWTTSLDFVLSGTRCYATFNGETCPPVTYIRPDASSLVFQSVTPFGPVSVPGTAVPGPFVGVGTATLVRNGDGTYTVHDEDANTLVFDANGRVLSIKDPSTIGWIFSYPDASTTVVTHTNGQSMRVVVTAGDPITGVIASPIQTKVTDPAGNVFTYNSEKAPTDDIVTNSPSHIEILTSVIYPGAPTVTMSFVYPTTDYMFALKEVDYNGIAHDKTTYGTNGQVTADGLADGTQIYSMTYGAGPLGGTNTITNPLSHTTNYVVDANYHITAINGLGTTHCAATTASSTYDGTGNLSSSTDNNGNVTKYTYASNGLLQQKIEAYGASAQRTTDYSWDNAAANRLLWVKIEGFSQTDFTYDAHNRLTSTKVTNLTGIGNTPPQTTTYAYTLNANGMVASMTRTTPSPGNTDVDTASFDALGNLVSTKDGLGHTTSFTNYNALGEPQRVTSPNGDITDYTYDARGRVGTKTTYPGGSAATWAYGYDVFGRLSQLNAPDGEITNWNRNAVGVLQTVVHNDKDGTSTETFGRDANGDVTSDVLSRGGVVTLSESTAFDELGRPYLISGNNGQSLNITYDLNGNVHTAANALGHVTTFSYDALNRKSSVTDAGGASSAIPSVAPSISVPPTSSSGNYTVSWNTVTGAANYTLQQQVGGGAWQTVQFMSATSWNAVGKSDGTYSYRVQACNASGCGPWSAVSTITVAVVPSAPTSITNPTSSTTGTYTFYWNPVPFATSYQIQESANGGAWVTVYNGATSSGGVSGRTNGTYGYRFESCNANGCSDWSPSLYVTVAQPPASAPILTAPATNPTWNFTVSWTTVPTATSYNLYEQVNGGAWSLLQSSNLTTWASLNKPNGTYGYQVQACNISGCSARTATSNVVVGHVPQGSTDMTGSATSTTGGYSITWPGVIDATSYILQEQVNGGAWTTVQSGASGTWATSGRANGTYGYRVDACSSFGCGPWSATYTVTVNLVPSYTNIQSFINGSPYNGVLVSTAPMTSCVYSETINYRGASLAVSQTGPALPTGQTSTQSNTMVYAVGGVNFTVKVTASQQYAAGKYSKQCSGNTTGP